MSAAVNLSSSYQTQLNGQTEQVNQSLKNPLHFVGAIHSAFWSLHLSWIENAHNSFTCTATGMSLYMTRFDSQLPLFPKQEMDVVVPLVRNHLRHILEVWTTVRMQTSTELANKIQYTEQSQQSWWQKLFL